jgi:hypothetical protein
MSIAILDTNDCNLQLWHGATHLRSPGYALLAGKQYRFGREAREAARLQPRDINTRYWWQLSTEPLQPALGPARHTADLVHAHLLELHREAGEPAEVLLAVSSSMQRDQLALLLGIVQQCPFDAVGLVNRSVVLGSLHGSDEQLFHLEIQLHQALLSRLEQRGGEISFQRSVPLPGCGLLQLQERLVETIASAFIRQTRFDPRRKAATEQQLYNSLPHALRELGSGGDTNLEVSGYRARINHGELLAAGQRLFDGVPAAMDGAPTQNLIIDPVAALLPGLGEQFRGATLLAPDALHTAASRHLQQVVQREEALSFITSLPCLERQSPATPEEPAPVQPEVQQEIVEAPAPPPAAPLPVPTHLLQGSRARTLASLASDLAPGCELYLDERGWLLRGAIQGLRINGQTYSEGRALRCGDELDTGAGEPLRVIEVLPG